MIKWTYIKNDLKQLFREPIMALLLFLPLFIPIIFKLILAFLVPFIQGLTPFDITPFTPYIISFVLILSPSLLGVVMGFMLIDDRDNNIVALMQITPMGQSGYLMQRLLLVFALILLYVPYSYAILGLFDINFLSFVFLTILLAIYGGIVGLLLFRLASDKVNGLTYAKMLNIIMLFAFANLLNVKWITILAGFFPPYWISQIILEPTNIMAYLLGFIVHGIWLGLCLIGFSRQKY